MKRIIKLLALSIIVVSGVQAQYSLEVKEGIFFANLIKAPENITKSFHGWGVKSEIVLFRDLIEVERNNLSIGIGYTNFSFLDENSLFTEDLNNSLLRSYLNIMVRYRRTIISDKLYAIANISNYILLHEIESKFSLQNRIFVNVDLGIVIALNDRIDFLISTPITILPMMSGQTQIGTVSSDPFIDLFVELVGVDFGLRYNF